MLGTLLKHVRLYKTLTRCFSVSSAPAGHPRLPAIAAASTDFMLLMDGASDMVSAGLAATTWALLLEGAASSVQPVGRGIADVKGPVEVDGWAVNSRDSVGCICARLRFLELFVFAGTLEILVSVALLTAPGVLDADCGGEDVDLAFGAVPTVPPEAPTTRAF